jgi:hypothetical protein
MLSCFLIFQNYGIVKKIQFVFLCTFDSLDWF